MRPRILLLTMEPPRMPGSGGEVRSYYFIKTLTEYSEVTLISLGGGGGTRDADEDIARRCKRVIQPSQFNMNDKSTTGKLSRVKSWMRTLKVLAFPWLNEWSAFLGYCLQHCQSYDGTAVIPKKLSRRLLVSMLRTELNILSRFFRVPPIRVFLFSKSFKIIWPEVAKVLKQETFDLLWFEHSLTYPFAKEIIKELRGSKVSLVCNAHNVETVLQERMCNLAVAQSDESYWRTQTRLIKEMEKDAFNACELVIICSEQDKAAAQKIASDTDFQVIGNGVDVTYFRSTSSTPGLLVPTLVFTGGFGYGPNRDGLEFFIKEIFPLIKNKIPNCKFLFAGAEAEQAWNALDVSSDNSIEYVSNPADIRPCFEQALVYVVPLRVGGGTRLKVLEAMAMERAIVSTSLGTEGIPCKDGEHLVLADTPEDFSNSVVRLLEDDALRSRLEKHASAWVRQKYDWSVLCEDVPVHLNKVLQSIDSS